MKPRRQPFFSTLCFLGEQANLCGLQSMPSLPPATYCHYYPFGISDINTPGAILNKLKNLLIESGIFSLLWIIGNYCLNIIFIDHWLTYLNYHIYLIGQLYWFLIPYTLFIYVINIMLFEPLILNQPKKKYYIINACFISLCIVYIINVILGVEAHNGNLDNVTIFGSHSNRFCERILYKDCYFFSIYITFLYTFSFFFIMILSTLSLYTIQIYSKSYCSIFIQAIFCFKYAYWKLICNKKYRVSIKSPTGLFSCSHNICCLKFHQFNIAIIL